MEQSLIFNVLSTLCFIAFIAICRILRSKDLVPDTELFYQSSSKFVKNILANSPTLQERYIPMFLWGKSGHIQSVLFSVVGRFGQKELVQKRRVEIPASDGLIISYDLFQKDPNVKGKHKDELILVVPGICNTGDTDYVHEFSCFMNKSGYDVAVLNHTGALKNSKITQPRIFSYGKTDDLDVIVNDLFRKHRQKKLIGIGFSLGAQILMKYLGEKKQNQEKFSLAMSICQGYDLREACDLLQEWGNLRRFYNLIITKNMLKVISRHKTSFQKQHSENKRLDWQRIESSKALHELDSEFTLKVFREKEKLYDWYWKESCSRNLNKIEIPVFMVNAKDDPLVPECLFRYPKSLVEHNKNCLFVVTEFGGHLGFFEGGYFRPNRVSWIDRVILEYLNGALNELKNEKSIGVR